MSYAAPMGSYGGQPTTGDPGTLDLPYYGIGFVDAIKRGFQKFARFDGRASRSEYWWWALFAYLVPAVLSIIGSIVGAAGADPTTGAMGAGGIVFFALAGIWGLVILVPSLAITWRRLHDQNLSGLFWLLNLIPSVGGLIVFILMLMPSKPEGARFDRGAQQQNY